MKNKGNLYLIPTDIGNYKLKQTLPDYNFEIINQISVFIVENIRSARRFLKKAGYKHDFNNTLFHILDKHTEPEQYIGFLKQADSGKHTGLLSEAGLPCIADPGSEIVKIAHHKNISIIPLIGPSSIMMALMASGFNGQNFTFHGYLPIKKPGLEKTLKHLEKQSALNNQTQIFIETPYRNIQMFKSILKTCSGKTQLCIACNLSLEDSFIHSRTISEWKKHEPAIHKKPCVFLIYC